MIKKNYLVISAFFSLIIHFSIFQFLQNKKKVNNEIVVVDLSSYTEFRQYQPATFPPIETPKRNKKKTKPKIKDKVIPKKEQKKIILTKEQTEIEKVEKNDEKAEKIVEKKTQTKLVEKKKELIQTPQNIPIISAKDKKKIINQKLGDFLKLVSLEINKIAIKSYPKQSIKRREQGTITAVITLNAEGKLTQLDFNKRKPKRLYKATENIFKNYSFPRPPQEILNSKRLVTIKIPVNFILR